MSFALQGNKFVSNTPCPNCDYSSTYRSVFRSEDLLRHETCAYSRDKYPLDFPDVIVFEIFECEQCSHQRMIIQRCARNYPANYNYCKTLIEYPYPSLKVGLDLSRIPHIVKENLNEGLRCLVNANSSKGAIVNFRRALQAAILILGAKGKDLFAQIEDLYEQEIIRKKTKEIAHKVRAFGKFGAHPLELQITKGATLVEDEFGELTEEDAKQSLEALILFLEDAFIFSERLEEMDSRISQLGGIKVDKEVEI